MNRKLPPGLAAALVLGLLAGAREEAARATGVPKKEEFPAGGTSAAPASSEEPCGCPICTLTELASKMKEAGPQPGVSPGSIMSGFDLGTDDTTVHVIPQSVEIDSVIAGLCGLKADMDPNTPESRMRLGIATFLAGLHAAKIEAQTGTLETMRAFSNADSAALGALYHGLKFLGK